MCNPTQWKMRGPSRKSYFSQNIKKLSSTEVNHIMVKPFSWPVSDQDNVGFQLTRAKRQNSVRPIRKVPFRFLRKHFPTWTYCKIFKLEHITLLKLFTKFVFCS